MRAADRFDRLVLVAPPKALGNLREALDEKAKALVHGELAKDLVRVSPRDLEVPLGEVMPV
jgi:protein required for attachment to host cells